MEGRVAKGASEEEERQRVGEAIVIELASTERRSVCACGRRFRLGRSQRYMCLDDFMRGTFGCRVELTLQAGAIAEAVQ